MLIRLIEIGPQACPHNAQERPQYPVRIQRGHLIEVMVQRLGQFHAVIPALAVATGRIKTVLEQLHQQPRNHGMVRQQLLHIALRIRQPGLHQILCQGAQANHLPGIQPRQQHQSVEPIVFDASLPTGKKGFFEIALLLDRTQRAIAGDTDIKHLDPLIGFFTHAHPGRILTDHSQAKVLQHGQHIRQTNRFFPGIESQAGGTGRPFLTGHRQRRQHRLVGRQLRQVVNVSGSLHGTGGFLIPHRKGAGITSRQAHSLIAIFVQHLP